MKKKKLRCVVTEMKNLSFLTLIAEKIRYLRWLNFADNLISAVPIFQQRAKSEPKEAAVLRH